MPSKTYWKKRAEKECGTCSLLEGEQGFRLAKIHKGTPVFWSVIAYLFGALALYIFGRIAYRIVRFLARTAWAWLPIDKLRDRWLRS